MQESSCALRRQRIWLWYAVFAVCGAPHGPRVRRVDALIWAYPQPGGFAAVTWAALLYEGLYEGQARLSSASWPSAQQKTPALAGVLWSWAILGSNQ
jgi:hypothetical protein